MAEKKGSDIVRRSLFGPGSAATADEQPKGATERQPKQARQGANPPGPGSLGSVVEPRPTEIRRPSPAARRAVERTAITVSSDLLMRVKDAVAVLNGWPHQYTMARFVEEAFTAQLDRLKVDCNGGKEFPETNRKIRTGRPPGS